VYDHPVPHFYVNSLMRRWMNLFESATPSEKFMVAFNEATSAPNNPDRQGRIFGGVVLHLLPYDDKGIAAKLIEVPSYEREKGKGRAALAFLCGLADQYGVTIYAHALPQRRMFDRHLNPDALVAWYERYGFRATKAERKAFEEDKMRGLKMIRRPS
jgi:hypothetical protein